MNIKTIHNVYFIGIGGIGMSAVARYFKSLGKNVAGYDRTQTDLTDDLKNENIALHFADDVDLIPLDFKNIANKAQTLIIYTPAIPDNHKELNYFKSLHYIVLKRSEILGLITKHHNLIAVAGTHGKTTVSSIIAHLFIQLDHQCCAFLGGIPKNYNTNFISRDEARLVSTRLLSDSSAKSTSWRERKKVLSANWRKDLGGAVKSPYPFGEGNLGGGAGNYTIVEADEYDRSFLKLFPYIGVITSVDADHLDIYKDKENLKSSFSQFIKQIKPKGKLLIKKDIDLPESEVPGSRDEERLVSTKIEHFTYSLDSIEADFFAKNISLSPDEALAKSGKNGLYVFDLVTPTKVIKKLTFNLPGLMNLENAIAAIAVAYLSGIDPDSIRNPLKTFPGVKRRFDFQIKTAHLIFIDDYAHHPEELNACITSVKELFPDKKITGIFQPHLFSRTRDFADEFAKSLDLLDELILLDIYPAREMPIKGVSSKLIFNKLKIKHKTLCSKNELIALLKNKNIQVLLTLGAGDIAQLVKPIKQYLNSKIKE